MVEANTFGGESVDVRRFVILRTVTTEALPTYIIGHDEDDIGLLCRQRSDEEKEGEQKFHTASVKAKS